MICLASVSLGENMAYPTNALPQMRNETNIQVRLDDNEGSIFAALFWAAGIVMSPLGGALSGICLLF